LDRFVPTDFAFVATQTLAAAEVATAGAADAEDGVDLAGLALGSVLERSQPGQGGPRFSKAVEGHYELVPTIHGLLRWLFASPDRTLVNYDQERAHHIILQNAKLKVELRNLKRGLIPAEEK